MQNQAEDRISFVTNGPKLSRFDLLAEKADILLHVPPALNHKANPVF